MIDTSRVGLTLGPLDHKVTWRDVILYHLGIGARSKDLHFVWEGAAGGLQVCPSYAVIPAFQPFFRVLKELKIDLRTVLHGEEAIRLHGPIPSEGILKTTVKVAGIYDKKKAALVVLETQTTDEAGTALFDTRASLFCRGLGGWGGDPGPKAESVPVPRDRAPDFEISQKTTQEQAAIYRLSGDVNPLHIDPETAQAAGFPKPILHGLCTFGFATRAILEGACGGDVNRLKAFQVRFADVVFPGDVITTRGWKLEGGRYAIEAATERAVVLSHALAVVED
jgi:acyl dehydratase